MTNGDLLTGKTAKPSMKIQTDYGEIPVAFSEIKHVEMQGGNNVTAVIRKVNGDTMRGTLLTEEFTLNLDVGATVEAVYKDKLAQVVVDGAAAETGTHFGELQPIRGESTGAQILDGKLLTNSLGMKFVPVPGAGVLFCIWETRVQDFDAFVKATGHDATGEMCSLRRGKYDKHGDSWKSPGFGQGPAHPVVGVSWEDAKAFCQWLTAKERREGRLNPGQSYRLPTDSEWSLAVGLTGEAGGTPKDKDVKIKDVYPWGGEWPPPNGAGNYAGEEAKNSDWFEKIPVIVGYNDGFPRTAPVGSFKPNRFGIYDISGNVWEWCEDWYDSEQKYRVLRGGCWFIGDPGVLLSSYRFGIAPGFRDVYYGFRCVLAGGSAR